MVISEAVTQKQLSGKKNHSKQQYKAEKKQDIQKNKYIKIIQNKPKIICFEYSLAIHKRSGSIVQTQSSTGCWNCEKLH